MNRIIIGSSNKDIGVIKDNKVIVDVNCDTNVLIDNSYNYEYVFNVNKSHLNILNIRENSDRIIYNINVNEGLVSLNNISYNSDSVKINASLNKEESSILIYNSVIEKDKNVSYDITVNHNKKNTKSNIFSNGITKDKGSICFDVTSSAGKKSKACIINQDSKIISLNENNDNKINPVLLIDEFETEARHAAFIGNFNSNEIFYLMSRGLSENAAKNLLIKGLLIGTLDVCFNEKEILRNKLNDEWR